MSRKPIIGITMGDPAGVGPEIIVKALAGVGRTAEYHPVIIGDSTILAETIERLGVELPVYPIETIPSDWPKKEGVAVFEASRLDRRSFVMGVPQAACGAFSYRLVEKAVELALSKRIGALVTAPICKEAWQMAGYDHDGHTELLAKMTATRDYRMMFASKELNVILVSTHLSLYRLCQTLSTEQVLLTLQLGYRCFRPGGVPPRMAVCGLNPHAGENGLFGREELDIIRPAISLARAEGISVDGPLPSDTIFLKAVRGEYDLIVALYHDQGLIPLKLLAFESAVNITVGLPIIRTSVDHGTAFDIAGTGRADATNLVCAVRQALKMIHDPGRAP